MRGFSTTPQTALDDFKRLRATGSLDDLWVDVKDAPYDKGVIGKHITFNLEERPRAKTVDYLGSKRLKRRRSRRN